MTGAADAELLDALSLLERRRAPYAGLLAEIVVETLQRFPLAEGLPIVEIGAGVGQLSVWLPASVRARTVHTDPSAAALRVLKARVPDAQTSVAPAHCLPFSDGACAGALGLCVFDAIHESGGDMAVVTELARVLCPGGRFVHVLDMATLLAAPFRELDAEGLVPLPNVVGDPSAQDWPLDIVLLERGWLTGLLDLLMQLGHPLPTLFGLYFAAFLATPFNVEEALGLFQAVARNDELRKSLATQLASGCQLALQQGYPAVRARPFQSSRYLLRVLETSFGENAAFRIEQAEVVGRSSWRAATKGDPICYRSLCLGHERVCQQFPGRLLTDSSRAWLADGGVATNQTLVEAGVFVFVAQRVRGEAAAQVPFKDNERRGST